MKLFLTKGWYGKEKLVSETISESEISPLVYSLNWEDFASIRLEVDPNNWLEVSGNIAEDGLAVVYAEAGVHYISNDAPAGLSVLEETLKFYLNRDRRFTNIGFTSEFEDHPLVINRASEEDYEKWKVRFEARQQQEKSKKRTKKLILLLVVITIITTIPKLTEQAYHYEYQFFGHETALVIGDVMEVEDMYFKGDWIQRITYYFPANGKRHRGFFLGAHNNFSYTKGDRIQIKYAIDNPSISKVTGFVKEKND